MYTYYGKFKKIKYKALHKEFFLHFNIIVGWQKGLPINLLSEKLSKAGVRRSLLNKDLINLLDRYYYHLNELQTILLCNSHSENGLLKGFSYLLTKSFPVFAIPIMVYSALLKNKQTNEGDFRSCLRKLSGIYLTLNFPPQVKNRISTIIGQTIHKIPHVWDFQEQVNTSLSFLGRDISERTTDNTFLYTLKEASNDYNYRKYQ